MNLPSYADRLATRLAEWQIELGLLLEDGQISAAELPRLAALHAALPDLVNNLDWLAARIALAGQLLRRGPADVTPDAKLRRRLADLDTVRTHNNGPACLEQTEPLETAPTQPHEGLGSFVV